MQANTNEFYFYASSRDAAANQSSRNIFDQWEELMQVMSVFYTEYEMASSSAWRDFEDKLINAVQWFRVLLYDVTLKEFRNNTLKENAWQSVAREVNSSGLYTVYSDGLGRGFSQNS